jgi:hypothetical protein
MGLAQIMCAAWLNIVIANGANTAQAAIRQ